ncbi:MAG TPA: hypothetical protein VMV42_00285 [archaeon]|nr:hypothetical protein [archaeon]
MADTAIEIRRQYIPAKIEDLKKFILIGRQVVEAHKAKLRAITEVGIAAAAHQAALEDGQTVAEVVLDAEAKLGEMLAAIDKSESKLRGKDRGSSGGTTIKSLPPGIDKKMSHKTQQIYKHPEVVEHCKKKAREKGELVTSQCVLHEVRNKKDDGVEKERRKPGPAPRGYYLTNARLAFLREKIEHTLEMLNVPARSHCPVTLIKVELHAVQEELQKLQPHNIRKEHHNVI